MPIRIVLAALPPLLEGILREQLARELELEVVASAASLGALRDLLAHLAPDVVVLAASGAEGRAIASALQRGRRAVVVLAIAPAGDRAALYRLGSRVSHLTDVSATSLVAAIHGSRTS